MAWWQIRRINSTLARSQARCGLSARRNQAMGSPSCETRTPPSCGSECSNMQKYGWLAGPWTHAEANHTLQERRRTSPPDQHSVCTADCSDSECEGGHKDISNLNEIASLQHVSLYLDFRLDDSYTPIKIRIMAGTHHHDLVEVRTR